MQPLFIVCALILLPIGILATPVFKAFPMVADRATCPFPNGSATQVHTYNCDTHVPIQVINASVTDTSGVVNYPIDPAKPISIHLNAFNSGEEYGDDKSNVTLFEYAKGPFDRDCVWHEVPTLGLMNNIDGCQLAHNCPLTVGYLDLGITLDLTAFAPILHALVADRPYQLIIRMKNYVNDQPRQDISCTVSQLKFKL